MDSSSSSSGVTRGSQVSKQETKTTQPVETGKTRAKVLNELETKLEQIENVTTVGKHTIGKKKDVSRTPSLEEKRVDNAKKKPGFPVMLLTNVLVKGVIRGYAENKALEKGFGTADDLKSQLGDKTYLIGHLDGKEISFGSPTDPDDPDGEKMLEGVYFKAEKKPGVNQKTILLCTGSHKPMESYAYPMVEAFKEMGHNVMVFNYEGFGGSVGEPSEEGVYRSVQAAYDYLKQSKACDDDSIVAWGYSLGSGAASHLASVTEGNIDIVLDRGFSSMREVGKQQFDNKLMQTLAKVVMSEFADFDNVAKLQNYPGKVFIAHGREDEMTKGKEHVSKLQAAIGDNAQILEVPSKHHHTNVAVWFSKIEAKEIEDDIKSLKASLKGMQKLDELESMIRDPANTVDDIASKILPADLATQDTLDIIGNIKTKLERQAARQEVEKFLNRPPRS